MASSRRWWRIAIGLAAVAVGITSIVTAFAWWRVASWTGDLLTGLVLIGSGIVAMSRIPTSRIGTLLVVAGFAWFVGDFAVLAGAPGWVAGVLIWVHRGVLFHAILTVPSGRVASRFQRIAVACGYALSLVPWIWTNAVPATIVSLAAVGAAAVEFAGSWGVRRRAKRRALEASALLALSTVAGFAIRGIGTTAPASATALIVYEVAVVLMAVLLVLAAGSMRSGGDVADLAIELDEAGGIGLEGALRRELGDPELTILYAGAKDPDEGSSSGLIEHGRETLLIELDRGRSAELCTAVGILAESPLRQSVIAAIRLDDANRSLRMDVATQVEAVRASRTRLIRAADDAGRDLEERLHAGADERLSDLQRLLADCAVDARASTLVTPLAEVQALLLDAREDLARFSAGLHPRALDELGLAAALTIAAHESTVVVDLAVDDGGVVSPDVQLAAYFFCLEGMVNIAKHASARRAFVRVAAVDGELNLEVADDGAGGATPGSGIQGITDRIAALGGVVTLESPRAAGTRLTGRVPLVAPPVPVRTEAGA